LRKRIRKQSVKPSRKIILKQKKEANGTGIMPMTHFGVIGVEALDLSPER
jgi:hypothetical protein